jgi:hypothetical protein
MENLNHVQISDRVQQYLKTAFFITLLFLCFIASAHATDSTGISDLDTQATAFQSGVKVFAKWGGILAMAVTGALIGFGKAQGQVATYICWALLGIGFIGAGWGWFGNSFSQGFAF